MEVIYRCTSLRLSSCSRDGFMAFCHCICNGEGRRVAPLLNSRGTLYFLPSQLIAQITEALFGKVEEIRVFRRSCCGERESGNISLGSSLGREGGEKIRRFPSGEFLPLPSPTRLPHSPCDHLTDALLCVVENVNV